MLMRAEGAAWKSKYHQTQVVDHCSTSSQQAEDTPLENDNAPSVLQEAPLPLAAPLGRASLAKEGGQRCISCPSTPTAAAPVGGPAWDTLAAVPCSLCAAGTAVSTALLAI